MSSLDIGKSGFGKIPKPLFVVITIETVENG